MDIFSKMQQELNKEVETIIKEKFAVYKNPSTLELNKLLRDDGPSVRIIASERTKSFYVFNAEQLHFQACRLISEFQPILKLIATEEQPAYIFTATGEIENGKITLISSDILSWSRFDDTIRRSIKMKDWSFMDKYLNSPVKAFLKKLKVNKA